jgi:hypothetical protein
VVLEKKFERRMMCLREKPEEPTRERERETDPKVGKSFSGFDLRPCTAAVIYLCVMHAVLIVSGTHVPE